jgi:hypothetical protein
MIHGGRNGPQEFFPGNFMPPRQEIEIRDTSD